ncbi:hypothetical protein GUJ93_ZPchr0006g44801 [Zizania palustris]|uniref:Uncharacterized protein n=1 Tax=Zizania palustris TaxID=103762 RepID=A0A8J5W4K3_ZIZPA|nr:hypothetical protein GUJ93_ZPchr0006g44801 [Zizania palustris]
MKGRHHERMKKRWSVTVAVWLMLAPPLFLFVVLKTDFLPQVARRLDTARWQQQQQLDAANKLEDSVVGSALSLITSSSSDELTDHVDSNKDSNEANEILATRGTKDSRLINSDIAAARSNLRCNFSSPHMNTCAMEGDIRIHGRMSTVYVVASSGYGREEENATTMIRPYPRKWEQATMEKVREITIVSTPPGATADTVPPRCTFTSDDVPAVVFSTGGYSVNFFHTMNDIIIPLYITAREFDGRVQLLAANYDYKWTAKYQNMLSALSMYPIVDLDGDAAVRCFPSARVGVESHKVLGIIPGLTRNGYTMVGFLDFLRSAYALKRPHVTSVSSSRPRLVMVLRRKSRALTNEADVVKAITDVGFDVVSAGPDDVKDVARFAAVVNSCDVMLGVHGAGLTNMVFLPSNGTVVQIIPWGGMKWPSWYDYGEPVPAMGLRYVEYEVTADETTLKDRYPRDHAVFTDPVSIHRKGFNHLWSTFLNGQNVTLDINRFRGVMQQLYTSSRGGRSASQFSSASRAPRSGKALAVADCPPSRSFSSGEMLLSKLPSPPRPWRPCHLVEAPHVRPPLPCTPAARLPTRRRRLLSPFASSSSSSSPGWAKRSSSRKAPDGSGRGKSVPLAMRESSAPGAGEPPLPWTARRRARAAWRKVVSWVPRKARSVVLLNLVTLVFASNISVVKEAETMLDPDLFNVLRFTISAIPFVPLLLKTFKDMQVFIRGIELGIWVSMGYLAQAMGLVTADAGRASFISALTVIIVPFLDGILGAKIPAYTWIGAFLCLIGVGILELSGSPPCVGDLLILLSAFSFAIHMLRTEHISKNMKKESFPVLVGCQVLVVAFVSAVSFFIKFFIQNVHHWTLKSQSPSKLFGTVISIPWMAILFTGIFSTTFCLWAEVCFIHIASILFS